QVDAERHNLTARRRAHVDVRVVHREGWVILRRAAARQMCRSYRDDARNSSSPAEQRDAMTLELLIEERRESRATAHAPQHEIPIFRDVADHIPDLIDRTGDQPLGCPGAGLQGDVAGPVAR